MKTPRKQKVIVEHSMRRDATGVESPSDNSFGVWADIGKEDIIRSVEGVFQVMAIGTHYMVSIDKRYELSDVMDNVEYILTFGDDNA